MNRDNEELIIRELIVTHLTNSYNIYRSIDYILNNRNLNKCLSIDLKRDLARQVVNQVEHLIAIAEETKKHLTNN